MYEESRAGLVAGLRADLHNTSAREFGRQFEPADFMPGTAEALEDKVAELIAQGYNPAAAAAMATSKKTREQQIHMIDGLKRGGAKPKAGRGKGLKKA